MKKSTLLLAATLTATLVAGLGWWLSAPDKVQATEVVMYKNKGCMCCSRWADHLKALGHKVVEKGVDDLDAIKARFGVGEKFRGCHTALVDGYIIEGHVPMKEITRLLKERPNARGLSVPGMPLGSPGMEVPGEKPDHYTVFLMKKDGTSEAYARY